MIDAITGFPAKTLNVDAYLADFWPYFHQIGQLNGAFWKLECRQSFREPGNPSWEALAREDWDEALRIIAETTDEIRAPVLEASRVPMHRLRVVQRPYTPYLQWELQFIRVRAEAGERIRVLDAGALGDGRDLCRLPELVILDSSVMYEVLYDDSGTLSGARKILDTGVIESCRREVAELFSRGEDLPAFLGRDQAVVPPVTRAVGKKAQ
ncbi:DUF6879 family protein [Streptosporangium canum]|uniref:DUF6879 family protein n=1 Tax=Streptosporangium canum TaxID=324952 RepID=UPI0037917566